VDYDKDQAEIKWTHPKNDGGSPLTKYIIEKKMKGAHWEKVHRFVIPDQFTELRASSGCGLSHEYM